MSYMDLIVTNLIHGSAQGNATSRRILLELLRLYPGGVHVQKQRPLTAREVAEFEASLRGPPGLDFDEGEHVDIG